MQIDHLLKNRSISRNRIRKAPCANLVMAKFKFIEESIRGDHVYIIQATNAPVNDHLMELLILIDALKRASAKQLMLFCLTMVMLAKTAQRNQENPLLRN